MPASSDSVSPRSSDPGPERRCRDALADFPGEPNLLSQADELMRAFLRADPTCELCAMLDAAFPRSQQVPAGGLAFEDQETEMNRFEHAVHDCMKPTAKLLETTTKPLHRAILLNFWRHVHLEGAGEYDRILAPDMIVDRPVYRVTWGANPAVIEGKDGVRAFYNSVGEAVLWHSDDRLAVADWGVCDEITFHQLAMGSDLRLIGYDVERADRLYHVYSRQAFIWPYDERARLAGEHLYEDKTSLRIEEVDRTEAITPARVREIHRQQLAKLEAERGPNFWVLGGA